jgi:RNA polymerase sigma-70 factor, ECF subfamily
MSDVGNLPPGAVALEVTDATFEPPLPFLESAELLSDRVRAAQHGDTAAFDELVRATYASTYSLAYKLTGNPEDADDVAQDTYLRAFRGLTRFRGDAAFPTWLYRITVNSASNVLAKRRKSVSLDVIDGTGHGTDDDRPFLQIVETHPDTDPLERAVASELRERVRTALAGLPALLRQVVVLREVEGLPHSAIAERLGISEAAAKVRLHRARQKLKADLGDDVVGVVAQDPSTSADAA